MKDAVIDQKCLRQLLVENEQLEQTKQEVVEANNGLLLQNRLYEGRCANVALSLDALSRMATAALNKSGKGGQVAAQQALADIAKMTQDMAKTLRSPLEV